MLLHSWIGTHSVVVGPGDKLGKACGLTVLLPSSSAHMASLTLLLPHH